MNKVFHLYPVTQPNGEEPNAFISRYDKTEFMIVVAHSEQRARMVADERQRGEEKGHPWLDPKQTYCFEVNLNKEHFFDSVCWT